MYQKCTLAWSFIASSGQFSAAASTLTRRLFRWALRDEVYREQQTVDKYVDIAVISSRAYETSVRVRYVLNVLDQYWRCRVTVGQWRQPHGKSLGWSRDDITRCILKQHGRLRSNLNSRCSQVVRRNDSSLLRVVREWYIPTVE